VPGAGERAYAYARVCGIIGKSFVGKGIARLGGITRLSELDRLVFAGGAQELPERELLLDFEQRILNRAARQIITIVDSFRKPPELLVRMARDFEYADLRRVIAAAAAGEKTAPALTEIGRFATIDFGAYPRFDKMLAGTEFGFLLEDINKLSGGSTALIQNKLDRHYYTALWNSLFKLAPPDRSAIERILAAELSLRNASWALRMRSYYGMAAEQVRDYLVFVSAPKGYALRRGKALPAKDQPTLADDALASLNLALDSRSEWARWRWAKLLNPAVPGEPWAADPRFFQNAAARHLYRLAWLAIHRRPFALDTAACFIKLKLFEEDMLVSVAEGISLGMGAQETLDLMGVAS
jgi:vacuolar-type H+-ATPase subunit C/Vma6